jgi:F-type H+-transporting ATPase subunit delta
LTQTFQRDDPERYAYKMIKVIITVSGNMTDDTYLRICDGIEHKFNDKFEFVRENDDSVIGGFIVNINGKVYDKSISSQLEQLKKHLSE